MPADVALNINRNAYPYDRNLIGYIDYFDRETGEIKNKNIPVYEGDSIAPDKNGYGIYYSWEGSEDYTGKNYILKRYESKITPNRYE